MQKYISAARVYGARVIYVEEATAFAPNMSSAMPSMEQIELSLTIVITSFASAGRTFLMAVERQSDDAGNKTAQIDKTEKRVARNGDKSEESEVNDGQLDQQRRGAENSYVRAGDAFYKLMSAQTHERQQQRGDNRKRDRYDRKQQSILDTLYEEYAVFR